MADAIRYDRQIFARNLEKYTQQNGERQVDIARLLGVSKATVSAYFHGQQIPRMDKIEMLARHFGVSRAALLSEEPAAPEEDGHPAVRVYESLNDAGQREFIRYGRFLTEQPAYRVPPEQKKIAYIKHYLVPAAAGYASPIEGEDYELLERGMDTPLDADFCLSIQGDSMEPYIKDGSLVYVKRDAPLREFDVGIFFVDGDVFCKQWCLSYDGSLYLLSANPLRRDANITIPRESGRMCVCFGKVLLPTRLPEPRYV
jgi:transcriptional regulator with XRE-family HTH domain